MPEKFLIGFFRRPFPLSALLLVLCLAGADATAQHQVRDGHFNAGGGVRSGTGSRILDSTGSISATAECSGTTSAVVSGFWHHFKQISPLDAVITGFSCQVRDNAVMLSWALGQGSELDGIHVRRAEEGQPMARITGEPLAPAERSFSDEGALPGRSYLYQLEILEPEGAATLSFTVRVAVPPRELTLYQNYPNPFNPATAITFYLPERSAVKLRLYDVRGRMVRELLSETRSEGMHHFTWDGTDREGELVSSGVYFCILRAGKSRLTRKVILMR
jgi:hypothetical protein